MASLETHVETQPSLTLELSLHEAYVVYTILSASSGCIHTSIRKEVQSVYDALFPHMKRSMDQVLPREFITTGSGIRGLDNMREKLDQAVNLL